MDGKQVAGGALVLAFLTGCAGTVAVPAPDPTSTQVAAACQDLIGRLPSSVVEQVRRKVDPDSGSTAAWGNPPITLRCGVARPAGLTPTSEVISVNGVDWLPEQRSAGYLFTTVGRIAFVEVAVPSDYPPETSALADLSGPVSAAIPAA